MMILQFFRNRVVIVLLVMTCATQSHGQIVYGIASLSPNELYYVKIDLSTCTVCAIRPELFNYNLISNFTVLPDGSLLYYGVELIREEAPPASGVIWTGTAPGNFITDGVLAPNGLVYMTSTSGLYTFDPSTNTITYINNWPSGGYCTGLFYLNGVLHGVWFSNATGFFYDIIVDIANPPASVIGALAPGYDDWMIEITWNGINGLAALESGGNISTIDFYNPNNGSLTNICTFNAPILIHRISTAPPSVPEFPCVDHCVSTNAGMYNNTGPYTGCNAVFFQVPPIMISTPQR